MAIFHQTVKIISRTSGRSAVASASYRSGEKLRDSANNQTHDYTRKGGVVHKEIMAPKAAPEWTSDREKLWNAVEVSEKRKDAQLAREVEVALPVELDSEKQIELVRGFVRDSFVREGMIADIAIHDKGDGNPHAHIMLTMREITPEGFGKKNRDWNNSGFVEKWRDDWESYVNVTFALEDIDTRIDRRTLEAQGIERTPQIHVGHSPYRAEVNEQIKRDNETAEALRLELAEINVKLPEIERDIEREAAAPIGGGKPKQAVARRETEARLTDDLPNLASRRPVEAPNLSEAVKNTPETEKRKIGPFTRVSRPSMTEGEALEVIERESARIAEPLLDEHAKEALARKAELKKRLGALREQYEEIKDNGPRRSMIEWVTGRDKFDDTRKPLKIPFTGVEISYAKRWNQWIHDSNEVLRKEREVKSKYDNFERNAAKERERIAEAARAEALDKNPEAARVIAEAEQKRQERQRMIDQKAEYDRRMALKARLEQQEAERRSRKGRGMSR
jgi:hypothetical protein